MGILLSHIDKAGRALMVDVSSKDETEREAVASATVLMKKETLGLILNNEVPKGDVFAAARIAGIMAAKETPRLIPLCHPLNISSVTVDFNPDSGKRLIYITARVRVRGRTGVEMEALTAVSVAALTFYDMCKAVDREMLITDVCLLEKSGGKSGHFRRVRAGKKRSTS